MVSRRALVVPLVAACSTLGLVWGWSTRGELYVTPRAGFGYGLGILGTGLMVLLLLYSVRKRVRRMRSWGAVRYWFATHMVLGILGPVAILFHANFKMGSVNSSVAMACVLLVSSSGLIGRFIYPKIHNGLYGSRASLRELKQRAELSRSEALGEVTASSPRLGRDVASLEKLATADDLGLVGSFWRFVSLPLRIRGVRRRWRRSLRMGLTPARAREADASVAAYLERLRRVAQFRAYERLFSLWHAFHLPLCVMLFLAAAVHVVAVHMY